MIVTNLISPNKLIYLILTLHTRKVRRRQYMLFSPIRPVWQGQEETLDGEIRSLPGLGKISFQSASDQELG